VKARLPHLIDVPRLLVVGAPDTGAPVLLASLAHRAAEEGRRCAVLTADPGEPLFGPPGAASLGEWSDGGWRLQAVEAIASLDAARFRLPLLLAVERLLQRCRGEGLLLHGPGLFRGMAAAELLPALVRLARADAVAVLGRATEVEAIRSDLEATGTEVRLVPATPRSRQVAHGERVRRRSEAWAEWMCEAEVTTLDLGLVAVVGAPPPRDVPEAWIGRQGAILDERGATLTLGEVVGLDGGALHLRSPVFAPDRARAVAVRDARRDGSGHLTTAPAAPKPAVVPELSGHEPIPLPDPEHPHATRLQGTLHNGFLGDPLLSLRSSESGRVVLVDLGDASGLPARLAHRVTAVLLSHGHMDHSEGLVWLVRCRIGQPGTCRVVGPAGTAERLAALLAAFTWDRIGDDAPVFEVSELEGGVLTRCELAPGRAVPIPLAPVLAPDGMVIRDDQLEVRAVPLDHGIPVLAFALTEPARLSVRTDRVEALGLTQGPWLAELKRRVLGTEPDAEISLPDGGRATAGALAGELLVARPGQRLVYATDVDDTPANRDALVDLGRGAQLLLLEAAFASEHADRAAATGHLTASACGGIATAAGVERLIPFHLSSRYQGCPETVLREVAAACDRLWLPAPWRARLGRPA